MEKLGFLDLELKKNRFGEIYRGFIAILLSLAFFSWILPMFSINWSLSNMLSGGFLGGFATFWNGICDTLGNAHYIILKRVKGSTDQAGFFILVMFLVTTVINYILLGFRKIWPLIIYVLPYLILTIVLELKVDLLSFLLVCGAVIMAISYIKNGYRIAVGAIIMTLVVVIISGFISGTAVFGRHVNRLEPVEKIREKTEFAVGEFVYGKNPLNNGDLLARSRVKGKGIALEVKMSKPQSMYLKGFTGNLVISGKWQDTPNVFYYRNYPLTYNLQERGFNGPGQLAQAASLLDENIGENNIEIKAKKASKEFAYVPYDLTNSGGLADYNLKGDNYFYNGFAGKFKQYNYTASDNQVEKWTDVAAAFFANKSSDKKMIKKRDEYLESESHYNKFVYETYTFIAPTEREAVERALGKYEVKEDGHEDYKVAIENIRKYLRENFIYSEKTGNNVSSIDKVIDAKAGYDVQYATAAVAMFRHYGIPARYVEGFLITPEDAKKAKPNETIEIPMSKAHAWPEIYIDGIGFVPIEVCPKYDEVMKEADMNVGISNSIRQQSASKNDSKLEDFLLNQQQEDSGGAASTNWWLWVLLILLAAVALSLLYKLLRIIIGAIAAKVALYKLFYKEDPKVAVSGIYDCMCERGYPINEFVRNTGNRAAYSKEVVDEQTRVEMLQEYKSAKKEFKEMMKRKGKRLYG